jgi:hypothetical protein
LTISSDMGSPSFTSCFSPATNGVQFVIFYLL